FEFPVSLYLKLTYATTVTIDFQTDFQMYSIDTRFSFIGGYYPFEILQTFPKSAGVRVVNISITEALSRGQIQKRDTINGRATRKVTPIRIEKRQTVYPAYKYEGKYVPLMSHNVCTHSSFVCKATKK
ncbi:hypothetical protein ALC56_08484, partial [Trachymyrmex septentrionalis]